MNSAHPSAFLDLPDTGTDDFVLFKDKAKKPYYKSNIFVWYQTITVHNANRPAVIYNQENIICFAGKNKNIQKLH